MFEKLFNKLNIKNISTEDLYLCTIKVAKIRKNGEIYFKNQKYIVAKKINLRYFQDVSDGNLYRYDPFYFADCELYVRYSLPVISDIKYITYEEAKNILNEEDSIKDDVKDKILIKK